MKAIEYLHCSYCQPSKDYHVAFRCEATGLPGDTPCTVADQALCPQAKRKSLYTEKKQNG
jgi:hypothetical protein